MHITDMQREAYKTAEEHGFHESDRSLLEMAALVHSEVSEAVEAFRDGEPDSRIAEELADAVIRIGDTCGCLGLDLEGAIVEKMGKNRTRPYRHGGKKA